MFSPIGYDILGLGHLILYLHLLGNAFTTIKYDLLDLGKYQY